MKKYQEWFQNLAPGFQILVVVVVAIVIYMIYQELKMIITRPRVNKSNIPVTGLGSGNEIVQWNPDPLAQEVYQNLEGYNLNVYPETAQKILALQTDDQVKLLYNHYNDNYAEDYPTITKLFDKEWSDWGGYYKKVVSRFKSLGLD